MDTSKVQWKSTEILTILDSLLKHKLPSPSFLPLKDLPFINNSKLIGPVEVYSLFRSRPGVCFGGVSELARTQRKVLTECSIQNGERNTI